MMYQTMKTPRFLTLILAWCFWSFPWSGCSGKCRGYGRRPEVLKEILFDRGLMKQYETGAISSPEFYELYCERTGAGRITTRSAWQGRKFSRLTRRCCPLWPNCARRVTGWEFYRTHANVTGNIALRNTALSPNVFRYMP